MLASPHASRRFLSAKLLCVPRCGLGTGGRAEAEALLRGRGVMSVADVLEHADAGFGGGSPSSGVVEPGWCLHFGDAVVHPDSPAHGVDESVVVPAEQHPVIGVRRAALRVLLDVVDFAPAGGDTAAGDDAPAVAERDRAALVPVEDPFFGADS